MKLYFELAQGSCIRLCLGFEKKICDLQGWQLELIRALCFVAVESETYRSVCRDAWLRTAIILDNPEDIFSDQSNERSIIQQINNASDMLLRRELHFLLVTADQRITIHSNIIPKQAFLKKLQESQCPSFWFDELHTHQILQEAIDQNKSLKLEDLMIRDNQPGEYHNGLPFSPTLDGRQIGRQTLLSVEQSEVQELKRIGRGSEGTVYKVLWNNATYATKLFKTEDCFERERQIASTVLHPHIVHGFGFYRDVDLEKPYLLMEILNEDLHHFSVQQARQDDTVPYVRPYLSLSDALDVLLQVARGMESLHKSEVVHGDLKSQNVLLSHFEVSGHVRHFVAKVADFGSAQFVRPEAIFRLDGGGTTRYAAPEVLQHRTDLDGINDPFKLDIYGFGGVAYEVLTGHLVYGDRESLGSTDIQNIVAGNLRPIHHLNWRRQKYMLRYPLELLLLVERCFSVPADRPSFPEICDVLDMCIARLRAWEKIAANCRDIFSACLFLICLLVALCTFQHFFPGLISKVLFRISSGLLGEACHKVCTTISRAQLEEAKMMFTLS